MLDQIGEYHIDKILYEGKNSIIYHVNHDKSYALKELHHATPSPMVINNFRHEYEVLKGLDIEGVRKIYNCTKIDGRHFLVMEYFQGAPLAEFIEKKGIFTISEFLKVAISLVGILQEVHVNNIIHKDINPKNILLNPQEEKVSLIDFGIASKINTKMPNLGNPDSLEGTLTYISPEQTGRMNRVVDYRTDFYSLGITCYELLIGQAPFQYVNSMELVHAHIAKRPSPLHEVNPLIPRVLSDIVLCLLEKNAEDRYQSAFGIKHDLEQCLIQWENDEKIEPFELKSQDHSGKFHLVEKLYGRETELETLMSAFNRIASGKKELLLVAGYSGIGKSALVNEIHKPITQKQGYFIAGKYDQFQRDIPYSAVNQAFINFCDYLLTLSEQELIYWKKIIQEAVGEKGGVLTEMIPSLSLIIGEQAPVPEVGPKEAQGRFNDTVQKFVKAISTQSHPLVMFIDDLQWADPASLVLLKGLMTDQANQYFLLICAYRDNEVSPTHPFMMMVEELKEEQQPINNILLSNLSLEHVNQLVSDALGYKSNNDVSELSQLIHKKTMGNAFFTTQALKAIYEDHLLIFDYTKGKWNWDINKVEARNISDNVVELMANKIVKLNTHTQEVLRLAACIGNSFDLKTLSIICEKELLETLNQLMEAVKAGLILPLDDYYRIHQDELIHEVLKESKASFRFIHDRVQQAAYSLIAEQRRKEVHLRIGNLLLHNTVDEELEEHVFDIVGQLNQGQSLIHDTKEIISLIELNLTAGLKAKASAAHEPALNYFNTAYALLREEYWETNYQLIWKVYSEKALSEYSCAQLEQSEKTLKIVLPKSKTEDEKVTIYRIYIAILFQLSRHDDGVAVGREALRFLGVKLPKKVGKQHVVMEFFRFKWKLGKRKMEDLLDLPKMDNNHLHNICSVIYDLVPSSYMTSPDLMGYMSLIIANINMSNGNSVYSPFAYSTVGIVFGGVFKDFNNGYKLGLLAIKLNEKYPDLDVKARVHFLMENFIIHWSKPVENYLAYLKIAWQSAVDTGSLQWADYSIAFTRIQSIFFANSTLAEIEKENEDYYHYHLKNKSEEVILNQYFILRFIRRLRGLDEDVYENPLGFDPNTYKTVVVALKNFTMREYYHTINLVEHYSHERYDKALDEARKGAIIVHELLGSMLDFTQRFYFVLTYIAKNKKGGNIKTFGHYQLNKFLLKRYAKYCPENFLAQYLLVLAEEARLSGKYSKSKTYYKRAIEEAEKREFIQNTALCYELYAKFWLLDDDFELATFYMQKAHYLYTGWGALGKTKQLETQYPELLVSLTSAYNQNNDLTIRNSPTHTIRSSITSSVTNSGFLDLNSILKASHILSQEVQINRLVEKMLELVLENTGAERGFLLENENGNLFIKAESKENKTYTLGHRIALAEYKQIPHSIINYVTRSHQEVVLDDASSTEMYSTDPYIQTELPKSILCYPVFRQDSLSIIFYLENNLVARAFTPDRLEILNLLSSQIAISIENALLYQNLEQKVAQRTAELRETNKRVTDSIRYAERIQKAILPTNETLNQYFDDYFLFYRPRDIVSGDFYWLTEVNGCVLIAVADCTGHGVPGAFMSMIGYSLLNTIVNENKVVDPAKILSLLHFGISKGLKQDETKNSDGMDISICKIEQESNGQTAMTFAGAKRNLWYLHHDELQEIKGERLSIGGGTNLKKQQAFKNNHLFVEDGMTFFLSTDGIVDTPSPNRKKFGTKRLKELIWNSKQYSLAEQRDIYINVLADFQQDAEQRDDITLLGFKVKIEE